jgi:hypothetical protein
MSVETKPADSVLIDTLMDGYIAWREAAAGVQMSYERWRVAGPGERASAFEVYDAALDREELTAGHYRALVEDVTALRGG